MADRKIRFADSWLGTSEIEVEELGDETAFVIWRGIGPSGETRENGFLSVEDAERLGYFLFGVVNDFRARQAGDKR